MTEPMFLPVLSDKGLLKLFKFCAFASEDSKSFQLWRRFGRKYLRNRRACLWLLRLCEDSKLEEKLWEIFWR